MNIKSQMLALASLLAGVVCFHIINTFFINSNHLAEQVKALAHNTVTTATTAETTSATTAKPAAKIDYKKSVPRRKFHPEMLNTHWTLIEPDVKTVENMADIDTVLMMDVPSASAPDDEFALFEFNLRQIKLGKRYSNYGVTTPLLGWYVYIAKHSPETIYKLYNEGQIDNTKFSHLIDFGYLNDWYKHINNPNDLLLDSNSALLSIARESGDATAKDMYKKAFFEGPSKNPNMDIRSGNLLYSIDAFNLEERTYMVEMFMLGKRKIDPRSVLQLHRSNKVPVTRKEALALIKLNKYNEDNRMMASYYIDAAGLGDEYYFKLLLGDADDNARQPSNFYCAICGLALYSEGLIGSKLLDTVKTEGTYTITHNDNNFVVTEGFQ